MTSQALPGSVALTPSRAESLPLVEVAVRPARLDDIPEIIALHREAFADTFGGAFGPGRVERGANALATTWRRQGSGALRGMLIAEHTGHVIGTTTLRTAEMGSEPSGIAELAFQEELGVWGAMRSLFALSLLDHRVERYEGFIADVAVLPDYRRGGVARAMLRTAEAEARIRSKRYLGLYVSAMNSSAIDLYRSIGFYEVRVRRSFFARFFFGQGRWIYMRKDLG